MARKLVAFGLALGAAALIGAGEAKAQLNLYCTVQEEWCREMVTAFEKETSIKVNMSRKSSGELYAQVRPGYDDAAWVGYRLSEVLPLSLADKQLLLEMDDPLARLASFAPVIRKPD